MVGLVGREDKARLLEYGVCNDDRWEMSHLFPGKLKRGQLHGGIYSTLSSTRYLRCCMGGAVGRYCNIIGIE